MLLLVSAVAASALVASRGEAGARFSECSAGTRLATENLLEHAIPDAVHHRVSVPDDENAFLPWVEAAHRFEEINEGDHQSVSKLTHGIVGTEGPLPGGERGERLAEWLNAHTAVLDLVDRAAAMDRLQITPPYSERVDDSRFQEWRYLAVLKALRARRYAAEGNWNGALRDLNDILGLGTKLAEGDAVLVEFKMASVIQMIGLGEVQVMARNAAVPDEVVQNLLAQVHPPTNLCDVWARVLRVEFTLFSIPALAEYPADATSDAGRKWFGENECWGGRDSAEAILSLLRDHPRPFDPADTAHLMSQRVQLGADACHLPWVRAREYAEESPALSAGEKVLKALLDSEKPAPSADALRKARQDLLSVRNPLGRQLFDVFSVSPIESPFLLLTHWRATRVVLLAESYRRRKGQPVPSLSDLDLAENDVLTVDPFSGETFSYDPARGLLWSVGMNGVNDGGKGKPEGDDLVWTVTPWAP